MPLQDRDSQKSLLCGSYVKYVWPPLLYCVQIQLATNLRVSQPILERTACRSKRYDKLQHKNKNESASSEHSQSI